jgi:hypothetical protein
VITFALSTFCANASCCNVVAFWSKRFPCRCSALSIWLIKTSWFSGSRWEPLTAAFSAASRVLIDASWLFVVFKTCLYVAIFVPTYGAVVSPTTRRESAFAASSVFFGCAPVTVSEISGVARAAPAPDAVPTCETETRPRSAPERSPAVFSASACADAELVICATARGLVPKLAITTPPGETGCPSEISEDAL